MMRGGPEQMRSVVLGQTVLAGTEQFIGPGQSRSWTPLVVLCLAVWRQELLDNFYWSIAGDDQFHRFGSIIDRLVY